MAEVDGGSRVYLNLYLGPSLEKPLEAVGIRVYDLDIHDIGACPSVTLKYILTRNAATANPRIRYQKSKTPGGFLAMLSLHPFYGRGHGSSKCGAIGNIKSFGSGT